MTAAAPSLAHDPTEDAPVEWMRIFAACLAQQRHELSAEEVVQVAISEFRLSHHCAPELAASQCAHRRAATG